MPITIKNMDIPDVKLVEPAVFNDTRGYFLESYKKSCFENSGIKFDFVQDNHSFSVKNTIRGMHFQKKPYEQGKLVSVITGKIMDVAVDLRPNSKYFKKYVYAILSEENKKMLWVPPGFAHGFLAMEDSHVLYKVTSEYNKEYEAGIIWNDPEIAIKWPVNSPLLSEKDLKLPFLKNIEKCLDNML
jgi:dTDP-4-dehydrorhamnose 3,5-epimerase